MVVRASSDAWMTNVFTTARRPTPIHRTNGWISSTGKVSRNIRKHIAVTRGADVQTDPIGTGFHIMHQMLGVASR